ncbi:GIY-YIG nuclease family protein [Streptomyces sp. NPDC006207]
MAKHGRTEALVRNPYRPRGIGGNSGDRIPYSSRVDRDDPARTHILITIHKMEQAGVEIDDRAIEIATKLGQWHYSEALKEEPVAPGDVPRWKKGPREAGDRQCWIYYVRIGHLIKIGTSMALDTRFTTLRPNEVLALTPGGEILERELHRQFADLRANGEYFHPGKALQDHILALREEHGVPTWTASVVPDGQDFFQRG